MNELKTEEQHLRKRRDMGIAFALIGIAGITLFGVIAEGYDRAAIVFSIVGLIGGMLALKFGISLGEHRKSQWASDQNAVSPVIAVILMVAVTVVLAATVFVLVADIGTNAPAPSISFHQDSVADTLTVSSVSISHLTWGEFNVEGCTKPANETYVEAGDELTGCSGTVKVSHVPSNTLVYQGRFD